METIVSLSTFFTPAGVLILLALLASDLWKAPPKKVPEPRLAPRTPRRLPVAMPVPPAAIVTETREILNDILELIGDNESDPRIAALESRIQGLGSPPSSPALPASPAAQDEPSASHDISGRVTGTEIFGT